MDDRKGQVVHPLVVVGLHLILRRSQMALVALKRAVLKKGSDGISDAGRLILTRYNLLGGETDGTVRGTASAGKLFEILHGKEVRIAAIHTEEFLGRLDVLSMVVVVVIDFDTLQTGHGRDGFQSSRHRRSMGTGGKSLGGIENGTAVLHEVERRTLSALNFNNGRGTGIVASGGK